MSECSVCLEDINTSLEEVEILPLRRLVETKKGDWYNFDALNNCSAHNGV